MDIELQVLPKYKTVFGISYDVGEAMYKDKPTIFYEIGIGIGIMVFYFVLYKKGS
jgi:hypothetical protein